MYKEIMKRFFIFAAISILFAHTAIAQNLDRSVKPKPGPAPKIEFTDPVKFQLNNGITVLVVENHKLPKITATYRIDAGPIKEGQKAGVLDLLSNMLNEGTTAKSKVEFDAAIDRIGADIGVSSSGGYVSSLTRFFPEAFQLMSEALQSPAFTSASFQKVKNIAITNLRSSEKNINIISEHVVNGLSYGLNHPMGEFATVQSVSALTLADVKAAYQAYVTPSRGYLTIVGDIKPNEARSLVEKAFGNWKGKSLQYPVLAKVNLPKQTEIFVMDLPAAVQSKITLVNLVDLPLGSPDYHAVLLANEILGGGADSKLFRNLREKHGFTYGAYSKIGSGRQQALFTASAAVRNEKVDSAITEFIREIKVIRDDKVSATILQNAKNLYNGSFALGLEDPSITASYASNIILNGLPSDFYRNYLLKINAVTVEDIQRVSKKYFNIDKSRIIIIGNSAQFKSDLEKSGLKINYVDSSAQPKK